MESALNQAVNRAISFLLSYLGFGWHLSWDETMRPADSTGGCLAHHLSQAIILSPEGGILLAQDVSPGLKRLATSGSPARGGVPKAAERLDARASQGYL
jgi:hypothetical protein